MSVSRHFISKEWQVVNKHMKKITVRYMHLWERLGKPQYQVLKRCGRSVVSREAGRSAEGRGLLGKRLGGFL